MPSLYVPATQTMILDYGHRYTHLESGEVYGRTDYDDPAKLAEIGAFPLTMQGPADGMSADGWEIVQVGDGYVRRPTGETPIPVKPQEPPPENEYLKGYYEATRKLITLATGTQPPECVKLEDAEYQERCRQASLVDPVSCQLIVTSLMYCFFQLKFLGLDWEQFKYPEE